MTATRATTAAGPILNSTPASTTRPTAVATAVGMSRPLGADAAGRRGRRRRRDAGAGQGVGLVGGEREAHRRPGVLGWGGRTVAVLQLALAAAGRDVAALEGLGGLFGADDPYAFGLVAGGGVSVFG